MFGLGVPELVVILVIALLVFGPGKLPEVGKFLGKSLHEFRNAIENRDGDGERSAGASAKVTDETNSDKSSGGA